MTLPRVFAPCISAGELSLDAETSHYLRHVLRLAPDATLTLFDGSGHVARAVFRATRARQIIVEVEAVTEVAPLRPVLIIATALPKAERADWLVEKLTELGVNRILWISAERSESGPRSSGRQERLLRVARAACAQSGNAYVPVIDGPVPLTELTAPTDANRIILDPIAPPLAWPEPRPAAVFALVGPEGGFSRQELARAQEEGYIAASMGPHTLRVETAAMSFAAVCRSHYR